MAFSFYISLGKNKGFKLFEKDGPSIRIKLWYFSICITLIDIESIIKSLLEELEGKDNNEIELENKINGIESGKDTIEKLDEKVENIQKEIEFKEEAYKDRITELLDEVKEYRRKEEKLIERVESLELEVAGYGDVEDENEELKKYVDELEEKIKDLQETIEYVRIYFSIY